MAKIRSTPQGALYVTVEDLSESPTVQKQIAQIKESQTYKRLVQKRLVQKRLEQERFEQERLEQERFEQESQNS
ncbi:MAG: hypothetical protein GDA51_05745 [Ekhidna sp.]|nr:hypothetical protein [Ekhidna sp.]MBC6425963.1 hypothetical protein [Ekhidna sp.]